MTSRGWYAWAAVLTVVAAGHLSLFPRVADLDGFYHIGHALAYLEGSLFDTALPWATQSIIRDHGGDLWWGFHVLLLPFAALGVEAGMRLSALALTLGLAGAVYWTLRRHSVPGAGWWAALFLIAVPNVFLRYLMVRPHMVSMAASLALLSVLVRGRWWQAMALSALITWVHLSLFWMAPGVVAAFALVRFVEAGLRGKSDGAVPRESVPVLLAIPAVAAGTVAGWLLRPNAIATGELVNVQIIRLFAQKASEEPLLFAAELFPLSVTEVTLMSGLFMAVWIVGVGALVWAVVSGRLGELPREERTLAVCSLLISVTFLGLTLVSARRAMVQWSAFAFLALPLLWGLVAPSQRKRWLPILLVLLVAHVGWGSYRHYLNVTLVAFPATTLAGIGEYLEEAAEPGDVVFHAKWDNFGPLFARSRTAHYLGGMDPIFQFAHSPPRYWEYFYLSADVNVEWTCDAFPCSEGTATDTHTVLSEHFGARWVVVEPRRSPRLSLHLLNDPRYSLAHETQSAALFEVLPSEPEGGS